MYPSVSHQRLLSRKTNSPGFTLVELLVVVAIIVLMTAMAVPAFNAIRGGNDFTSELYNMAGILQQGRAYAMANNTYVLAGITEVSAAQDTSATPQASGAGRIAIGLIASQTGLQPYAAYLASAATLSAWAPLTGGGPYGTGGAFVPVCAVMQFPNLHMVDLQYGRAPVPLPTSGSGMARPYGVSAVPSVYDISSTNCISGTPFAWPLGTQLSGSNAQLTFTRVIEFDPLGSARILVTSSPSIQPGALPQYIEIGLQPSHGATTAPAPASQTAGHIAAIQITGISGAIHIYRP